VTAPYIDPKLEKYRPLIDSLMAVTGARPDSILRRFPDRLNENETGRFEPNASRILVSPRSRDERRTLMHEMGHAYTYADQPTFYNWFEGPNPTERRDPDVPDLERFADTFADAFDALSQRAPPKKGATSLAELLSTRPPFASSTVQKP
jgi:hypothetical protein